MCAKLIQLPVVHMMLTQHSLFLPTLLKSEDEENPDSAVKGDPSPPPSRFPDRCRLLLSSSSPWPEAWCPHVLRAREALLKWYQNVRVCQIEAQEELPLTKGQTQTSFQSLFWQV